MDDRLADLMIAAETDTLTRAEEAELRELLAQTPRDVVEGLRLSVFAVRGALRGSPATALPSGLRERLIATGTEHLSKIRTANGAEPKPLRLVRPDAAIAPRAPVWAVAGWLAAAAAIGFAAFTWFNPRLGGPAAAPSPAWAAVDARPDTVRIAFKPQTDALRGASGEVVWNDALQTGYVKLTGLPKNDPGTSQYQLWLVDPKRDSRPVDGGVFDVTADGAIIPIDAKLAVDKPGVFAVTEEQPGGVVVSDGPMLLVAARG